MREELITLETAKLAREKEFNLPCIHNYLPSGILSTIKGPLINEEIDNLYSAPTQSLLQRWLREKHNIVVYVTPIFPIIEDRRYEYSIFLITKGSYHLPFARRFDNIKYEEALEK